ncbi:ABC transporter substrate-binding protein [Paenibacillus mucilaginosus]|nr:sugar ABC transporter substrate-binding protein [Paenibacillus mucilaginosus]AEI41014.1 extracellular solute-binding protein family 1 [Paenibacillus mucilaginosus KNP414]AFH61765.1 ABC transporter substrate-binding protein [Paenibacillus mucilaginosus K02]MCG7211541.1 sugar ABC transporter substrate-binding protein [Paenibacillus mucilaginosus]WDM30086.1 sugar ABC transporter substrate-binding protein [Paenibacillus mucilaginosus]WFA18275.1 sugar ABC transporter substrate-binding protein [P
MIEMKWNARVPFVMGAAALALLPLLQACGTDGGSGGSADAGSTGGKVKIKWSTWGNPGELGRFQEFTKDYNAKHPNVEVELIPIPSDYDQKILTQLSGGAAPDVFYAGDAAIVKMIDNGTIADLSTYMKEANSKIKPDSFFPGLWGAAKKGDQIYGVPVDCNPLILWYNKKLLQESGVSVLPADLHEKGEWTWAAFQGVLEKLRAAGKHGFVLDNSWTNYYSFATSNGGTIYNEKGDFVADKDPKTVEAFKFLYDNVKQKNMTFAGTLPKGQGGDAMFMSNQVGFVTAGRWYLPIFKQNKDLQFDIVPYPTNTGKKIEPAAIAAAYMVMNKSTKHPKEAFDFINEFNAKEGQTFRLQGGGNAVPSVEGADAVVMEGNVPEHAKFFLDTRGIGFALMPAEAGVPGLSKVITDEMESLWLKDGKLDETLKSLGTKANQKIQEYKSGK